LYTEIWSFGMGGSGADGRASACTDGRRERRAECAGERRGAGRRACGAGRKGGRVDMYIQRRQDGIENLRAEGGAGLREDVGRRVRTVRKGEG
jgi:hypothetical protein